MKKIILLFVISFLLFALSHPALTLTGASNGLMIWFEKLLPTLLPFLIAVNLLQNADIFTSALRFFPRAGSVMAILAAALPGFLFGLPVGAKLTADFTEKGLLTQKAGNLLLICCNQLSPAFVGSYVMIQCLNSPDLIPVSYLLLYLPPAIYSMDNVELESSEIVYEAFMKSKTSENSDRLIVIYRLQARGQVNRSDEQEELQEERSSIYYMVVFPAINDSGTIPDASAYGEKVLLSEEPDEADLQEALETYLENKGRGGYHIEAITAVQTDGSSSEQADDAQEQ